VTPPRRAPLTTLALAAAGVAGAAVLAAAPAPPADAARAQYGAKADVQTLAATRVQRRAATLNALVGPNGQRAVVRFQIGPSRRYGRTVAAGAVGARVPFTRVAVRVAGLRRGKLYHFRAVVTNRAGTVRGRDRTFRAR
jgi:hypothetical protein